MSPLLPNSSPAVSSTPARRQPHAYDGPHDCLARGVRCTVIQDTRMFTSPLTDGMSKTDRICLRVNTCQMATMSSVGVPVGIPDGNDVVRRHSSRHSSRRSSRHMIAGNDVDGPDDEGGPNDDAGPADDVGPDGDTAARFIAPVATRILRMCTTAMPMDSRSLSFSSR